MKALSEELTDKSIAAVISAIEIYNKPDFKYREETFAILMVNAWELLLKAKAVKDASEDFDAIVIKDPKTGQPKPTRSGNPLTHEVTFLARKIRDDSASGLTEPCHDNICLLVEVRDNAIHFMNRDLHFGQRVQEIGTASLKNYLDLAARWFGVDMSRYNFYLMPLSFYHGFESAEPVSLNGYNEQTRNFLRYLETLEEKHASDDVSGHQVTVCIETKFARAKSGDGMPFRWTEDPNAPAVTVKEEDVFKQYSLDYSALVLRLRERYTDFKSDDKFHRIKRRLNQEGKPFCIERYLDPIHKLGIPKWFYSPAVFKELDKHYTRRSAAPNRLVAPAVVQAMPSRAVTANGQRTDAAVRLPAEQGN